MFDLDSVAIDAQKAKGGVWWELRRESSGHIRGVVVKEPTANGCVLIAPLIGIRYERALDEARRPYLSKINDGQLSEEDFRKIQAAAMADCVLLDWRNISSAGVEISYSKQKAYEMLADIRWTALFDFVDSAARNRASILLNEEVDARGN